MTVLSVHSFENIDEQPLFHRAFDTQFLKTPWIAGFHRAFGTRFTVLSIHKPKM